MILILHWLPHDYPLNSTVIMCVKMHSVIYAHTKCYRWSITATIEVKEKCKFMNMKSLAC